MECSSTPSMSQQANLDGNLVIPFGSLCINKDETVSAASVPSSFSSPQSVSPGKKSSEDRLQETRVVKEETKGPSSSSSTMSFPNLPSSPVLNGFMELPSSNPQQNIWASPYFYTGGNTMPQNIFGTNYAPGNCYGSQGGQPGVNSFHPYSAIYENSGLNYPSGVQNLGFSNVVLDDNDNKISWDDNTSREKGCYNYTNLALAAPFPYTQQLETSLPGFNFLKMALSSHDSEALRKILKQGKYLRETNIL